MPKFGEQCSPSQMKEDLLRVIDEIENGTFEGVVFYSNWKRETAWMNAVRGSAEDRWAMVRGAIISMQNEQSEDARDWFFSRLYDVLSHLRPHSMREAERAVA